MISIPRYGPVNEDGGKMEPMEQKYRVVAYADDVKPVISSMEEFIMVIEGCTILEKASGVKLHRDRASGKVKFLPLGRWIGTMHKEDIPYQFIQLSDNIDFIGVE